jgi:hypothetical protein
MLICVAWIKAPANGWPLAVIYLHASAVKEFA